MKLTGQTTLIILLLVFSTAAHGQQMKIEGVAAVIENEIILYSDLIGLAEQDAAIQKRELAQPLGQCVEAVLDRLKHLGVWLEGDLRAAALRLATLLELRRLDASFVALVKQLAPSTNLDL